MKLVSRFEAAVRSTTELYGLLGEAKRAFSRAARGSQDGRDAEESIRNIQHELKARKLRL